MVLIRIPLLEKIKPFAERQQIWKVGRPKKTTQPKIKINIQVEKSLVELLSMDHSLKAEMLRVIRYNIHKYFLSISISIVFIYISFPQAWKDNYV